MKEILKMINSKEKGIKYFINGDRRMGDYLNDKPIGIHVRLTLNGIVKTENHELIEKDN